ncbi:hypothetical protein BJV82DRAFT_632053 [Fennellomyces sp. T-0311]|nr:hypothetical protein BJV82DRAFT_631938 [Fennellomyces sp. T-0311]KAI8138189.1 hypothetical protein BJV82DRAFT_632053 [Fennellomyces sp. T-0311]
MSFVLLPMTFDSSLTRAWAASSPLFWPYGPLQRRPYGPFPQLDLRDFCLAERTTHRCYSGVRQGRTVNRRDSLPAAATQLLRDANPFVVRLLDALKCSVTMLGMSKKYFCWSMNIVVYPNVHDRIPKFYKAIYTG